MDLREIITTTRNYNFHTHTQFCDGHDTMQAMADAAVACGFTHLGFSPHSPIAIKSPCNMSVAAVGDYRREIARLSGSLPLQLYMGLEIDYLSPDHSPSSAFFRDLGLDFAIGSVHFIPTGKGEFVDIDGSYERFCRTMETYFDGDIRYVVETFYNQSAEMIAHGGFEILGHLDKIAQNGALYHPGLEDETWYVDIIDDFMAEVLSSGLIVEINTKARESLGRFFPHERYWRRLIDAGVTLPVNSDAHYADRLTTSRAEAFTILESYGYDS